LVLDRRVQLDTHVGRLIFLGNGQRDESGDTVVAFDEDKLDTAVTVCQWSPRRETQALRQVR
jgi:hypothetical protein